MLVKPLPKDVCMSPDILRAFKVAFIPFRIERRWLPEKAPNRIFIIVEGGTPRLLEVGSLTATWVRCLKRTNSTDSRTEV